jgi:hypothetical protein
MPSTPKLRDSDPHDDFAIAPDVVPAAWADKVLADITRDANSDIKSGASIPLDARSPPAFESPASDQPPPAASAAGAAAPKVDTGFRATATDDIGAPVERPPSSRWVRSAAMLVFAICSAAAAAAWQNHGDGARQMLSNWVPAFVLTSLPSTEKAALAEPADTPAVQASAPEQPPAPSAAPAQPLESAAPAAAAPAPDTAQVESMARDLAAMAQQVEQLKASIAELKAGQQATARDVAKISEVKPAEIKPTASNPRPRIAPPPRTAAAPPHRPLQAQPPAQARPPVQAAAPTPSPPPYYPPVSAPSAPPPQDTARADDDGPIVRPPMPLR